MELFVDGFISMSKVLSAVALFKLMITLDDEYSSRNCNYYPLIMEAV